MENDYLKKSFIETANGRIFYFYDNSFPNRPFAVFLHGLSSNHTTWLKPMEVLHQHKYNVLAPDLRGHGFSDKIKNKKLYQLPVFSNDLREIIKKEGINSFILIGYSFGGQVALEYVSKYPESIKGLVLLSTNHINPFKYWKINLLTPIAVGFLNLLAIALLWQKKKTYYYYQHGKAEGYWGSVKHGLMTMPLSINLWMLSNMANIDFKESIKKIKVPTDIVWSKKDFFITKTEIKDMANAIKGAKVIISKNENHFIGTNSQNETIEIIINFLDNKFI